MATRPLHTYCFELQYDKAFTGNHLFRAHIVDQIHNRVQAFLHSFNMTSLCKVETGTLLEFGELQQRIERGEWVTFPLVWVELPAQKEDGRRKSDSGGGLVQTRHREEERNRDM